MEGLVAQYYTLGPAWRKNPYRQSYLGKKINDAITALCEKTSYRHRTQQNFSFGPPIPDMSAKARDGQERNTNAARTMDTWLKKANEANSIGEKRRRKSLMVG